MITVLELFEFCSFIGNKNLKGAFTPKGFNVALKAGEIGLYDDLRGGKYSDYIAGRPVPVVGMEQNMTISEELNPFILTTPLPVSFGNFAYPANFVQCLGLQTASGKEISWVKKEAIPEHTNSVIDPITEDCAIFTNVGDLGEVYPKDLTLVKMYYLRYPVHAEYGYDVVGGKAVYNPSKSKNSEFNHTAFLALASRVLSYLGFNIDNEALMAYSENLKTQSK